MELAVQSDLKISTLIQKTADGELEAFNQLVLKHQKLAYHRAYQLMGDRQSAEDVTQESFIKAFQNMGYFRGESFRAWLLKIVTNTCYDFLRRAKRHPMIGFYPRDIYGNEIESPAWLADPQASVQEEVEAGELSHILYRRLEEMPDIYRDILMLIDVADLGYAETAEVMNIPIGTVKSRLARGRLLLKKRLSDILIYRLSH